MRTRPHAPTRSRLAVVTLLGVALAVGLAGPAQAADIRSTVVPGRTLTTATPRTVSITQPDQRAFYTFSVTPADVAAGKRVTAELSNVTGLASTSSDFQILAPGGTVFYDSYITTASYVTAPLTTPGTYTVFLDPVGTATGSAMLKVILPVDVVSTVKAGRNLGTAVPRAVAVTEPGQRASYSFSVTAADVTARRVITAQLSNVTGIASTSSSYEVLAPGGTTFTSSYITTGTYVSAPVTTAGTWTIRLDPAGADTGTALLKVILPVDTTTPVARGATMTGATPAVVTLNEPGQRASYTFGVTAADVTARRVIAARLSSVTGIASTSSSFELLAPGGTAVTTSYITTGTYVSPPVTTAGTWTIRLDPAGAATGSALLTVILAVDTTAPVTRGTTMTGATPAVVALNEPGQRASYTFGVTSADVTAGRVIAARLSNVTGIASTSSSYELLAPGGTTVTSSYITTGTYVSPPVTTAGTWTIRLDPAGAATGSALLTVILAEDVAGTVTAGTAIATAEATVVSIPEPGQKATYTFTVRPADVAAGRVVEAQLSGMSSLASTASSFRIIRAGNTDALTSYLRNGSYVTAAVSTSGTYRIVLDPAGDETGTALLKVAIHAP